MPRVGNRYAHSITNPSDNGNTVAKHNTLVAPPAAMEGDSITVTAQEDRTDITNAYYLIDVCGGNARWVGAWDKWMIWCSAYWGVDNWRDMYVYAKQVAFGIWDAIDNVSRGYAHDNPREMAAMYAHARYSASRAGLNNMIHVAANELVINPNQLDADPWSLNVDNGTLDLHTGQLRPHRREDYITKMAPVAYDPKAPCPRWRKFLHEVFDGDRDLCGYIQRLVGYSLTGVTTEHVLPFLYGDGANGKSTFCQLLMGLLGNGYAMKAAPDLLMAKRGESHPTDRADLFGRRIVVCVETEAGRGLAEALVKELTGGDHIRARHMRQDFWEFTPTHHIWLAGNHKPNITGTDHGIWRRIKLIPFEVVFPLDRQDPNLLDKIKAEMPGILNWALAGCLEWQRGGLCEPDVVRLATTAYAKEMDDVGRFVEECCQVGSQYKTSSAALYEAFRKFLPDSQVNQHGFGARLRQKGFEKCRTSTGIHGWQGLRLQPEPTPTVSPK